MTEQQKMAEKICDAVEYLDKLLSTIRHNIAGRAFHNTPTVPIGDLINDCERKTLQIKIICANADADGKCKIEPPHVDIDNYHCSRCACQISGGFREGAFGEGKEWWNDPFCPGCGREIEATE